MFSGTAVLLDATTDGAISAASATVTGLAFKNVSNGGARGSTHPTESGRSSLRATRAGTCSTAFR